MTDSRDRDQDPFVILGVSRNCVPSEVKRAYRLLARQFHPDLNPGPLAAERMSRINLAYTRALRQAERNLRLSSRLRVAPTVPQADDAKPPADPIVSAWDAPAAPGGSSATSAEATPDATPTVDYRHQRPDAATSREAGSRMHVRSVRGAIPPIPFAHAPRAHSLTRKGRGRAHGIAIVASLLGITVLGVLFARMLDIFPFAATRSQTAHTSLSAEIRLGDISSVRWSGGGFLSLQEQALAQLAPNMTLNEPPQWSRDAAYTAISVTPQHDSASASSMMYLLRGSQILATLPAASGRWSPITNQLAVVTNPTIGRPPQLEIVSLAAINTPRILDRHASTHLAWSEDGTRIAYSADGQQQLRMVSVQRGSYLTLVKAHGQRLTPIGWRDGQIMQIVHNVGSEALVGVDSASGQVTLLAPLVASVPESTITVGHGEVTYIAKEASTPFVTVHWASSSEKWQAELPGIRSVRLLAAWSADGTWLAFVPTQSTTHTAQPSAQLCLAHLEHAGTPPPPQWYAQCLQLPGVLMGMNWELQSNTLSYVRAAQTGGKLELRALSLAWRTAMSHSPDATVHRSLLGTPGPLALMASLGVRSARVVLWRNESVSGRSAIKRLLVVGDP